MKSFASLKAIFAAKLPIVNAALDEFARQLADEIAEEDSYTQTAITSYLSLLNRGGKRLRGMLVLTGYELYHGGSIKAAAQAAAVIEACHAYMLVMDDVADNSVQRRGGPAAHIQMGDFITRHNPVAEASKKGVDMAETAALYAQHKAQSIILRLEHVPYKRRVLAMDILNDGLARTGIGQLRDMSPVVNLTLDDILQIATYKTAYYTFLLPLQVGAILAGAGQAELDRFEAYALHAGLAFQLHDDILGTFGDDSTTGKPNMSDIMEGKKTVLIAKTLAKVSREDKRTLLTALGNPALKKDDFTACLNIIRRSGALAETRQLATQYARKAEAALDHTPATWTPASVQFLRDLARYSVERDT